MYIHSVTTKREHCIIFVAIMHSFYLLPEKFPMLLEMFHSLDVWHKAKKVTKALHQVHYCCFVIYLVTAENHDCIHLDWSKSSK